jgi:rare lipoprotein A
MVRAMGYGARMSCPDLFRAVAAVVHRGGVTRGASLAMAAALLWLAGCASGPAPVGGHAGGASGRVAGAPARSPDKDGAPLDAPPDLASLPDPVPQIEPIKPGGPNKPYVVLGQSYEPVAADVPWKEKGVASWYGTKFHGRRTASGEMFSMYGLTAAHRTLPIPSYARVRNTANGKETIVRINDRGPFHSSRVMDLSYAAAVKLGIASAGSAPVEIERLTFDQIRTGAWRRSEPGPEAGTLAATPSIGDTPAMSADDPILAAAAGRPGPAGAEAEGKARAYTPDAKGFWVQLAALGKRDGVDKLQQRVAAELSSLLPMLAVFHEAPYFKLQVGPYGSRNEAQAAAQQARAALQLSPLVVERR